MLIMNVLKNNATQCNKKLKKKNEIRQKSTPKEHHKAYGNYQKNIGLSSKAVQCQKYVLKKNIPHNFMKKMKTF